MEFAGQGAWQNICIKVCPRPGRLRSRAAGRLRSSFIARDGNSSGLEARRVCSIATASQAGGFPDWPSGGGIRLTNAGRTGNSRLRWPRTGGGNCALGPGRHLCAGRYFTKRSQAVHIFRAETRNDDPSGTHRKLKESRKFRPIPLPLGSSSNAGKGASGALASAGVLENLARFAVAGKRRRWRGDTSQSPHAYARASVRSCGLEEGPSCCVSGSGWFTQRDVVKCLRQGPAPGQEGGPGGSRGG